MTRRILLTCWIAFLAPTVWAGDSVLYSITDQSVMYPATNRPVSVSFPEYKTDIFAVDPETGKQRKLFSDANAEFVLLPGGTLQGGVVAAGGRIFSMAVDRQAEANGQRGTQAVYELSTDGSGKARKILGIEGEAQGPNFRNLFVSPSGSRIGHTNYIGGKTYVFIYETTTGKLLRKTALRYGSEERTGWRFGSVAKIAWMPDDKRIFFAIDLSGDSDDAFWTSPNSPVGTYVMSEDADTAERLAPEAALHPKLAGLQPSNDVAAVLIGILPDGQYLLRDVETAPAGHNVTYLYVLDLAKKTQKTIPTNEIVGSMWGPGSSSHLSPSGRQLALAATQKKYEKQPKFSVTSTEEVWMLDLESGKGLKLLSFAILDTAHDFKGPWINLIGWLEGR